MKNLILASALTVLATGAFAQEAPYTVRDGKVVYTGQTEPTMSSMDAYASKSSLAPSDIFVGGNINWDSDYNGR
ncbi:MAG: hypothetical protein WBA44_14380 [Mesorhizobium sp.]